MLQQPSLPFGTPSTPPIVVPTDDAKVRAQLRALGEPVTLFGEIALDRRTRLKAYLKDHPHAATSAHGATASITSPSRHGGHNNPGRMDLDSDASESEADDDDNTVERTTLGPTQLQDHRSAVTHYAMHRTKARLALVQREVSHYTYETRKARRHAWYKRVKSFETAALQVGDERPLGYCAFSPNSRHLATASFSGSIKVWHVPHCTEAHSVLRGHKERVSCVAWHPAATLNSSLSPSSVNLASGAVDGTIHLYPLQPSSLLDGVDATTPAASPSTSTSSSPAVVINPIGTLSGHSLRVARTAFHPSGLSLVSTSFDTTWRLWDMTTTTSLLLARQPGHSRPVFALGHHPDGSLLATGGMDALTRLWDLRSGQSIMLLRGHVKGVLDLDWSPNGYTLATGSEDHTVRVWDVRAAGCVAVVPAHTSLVSGVKFWHAQSARFDRAGSTVVSSSSSTSSALSRSDNKNGALPNNTTTGAHDGEVAMMEVDEKSEGGPNAFSASSSSFSESYNQAHVPDLDPNVDMEQHLINGSVLLTCSYDGTAKLWTDGDFKAIHTLSGLESKVMSCDFARDGEYIATASYDRTFKLYATTTS